MTGLTPYSNILSLRRFSNVWFMCLLILFVLYGVTIVNCLLKAFALSMSMMGILILKQMLLFYFVGCFLLDSFTMVFFFSFWPFPLVRGGHSISSFSTSFCLHGDSFI